MWFCLIASAIQLRSAYIEACITVGMYNLHNCIEVTIDCVFNRSYLCVNSMRNKDPS